MMERRQLLDTEQFALKNMPMRPRARRQLLERPGVVHMEEERGEVILVPELGQLRIYWGFENIEAMRHLFPGWFDQLRSEITPDRADYVAMDLVSLPNRDWLDPMLHDASFVFFAEWLEMSNPDISPEAVPEFPDGVTMRRGEAGDIEPCREIWAEAYGEYADGPRTFDATVEEASWHGVMEADGNVVAFAFNSEVDRAEGTILSAAVAPEAWGNGYGRLILEAAAYQLATQEARRATIRVRPDIKQGLRACTDAGFRFSRGGLEFRRTTDEEAIAREKAERRVAGVKARFGKWR
jgi:GNAT superfamily N-acetyltransferase